MCCPSAPRLTGFFVGCVQGAGGFLQSAIFGTSGMRLVSDGLTFNPPPPRATGSAATMMGVRSFHFRGAIHEHRILFACALLTCLRRRPGHRLSQQVTEETMSYSVISSEASAPALTLTVDADGSKHQLAVGAPVSAPRGKAKITVQ